MSGGGVAVEGGSASIVSSTISDNEADGFGGGLYLEGTDGELHVTNSTVSDNDGFIGGGSGVYRAEGNLTISASTLAANGVAGFPPSATIGSAGGTAGTIMLEGSVVAPEGGPSCSATISSGGYNVSADSSCGLGSAGDQQDVVPGLAILTDNGGPTLTHLLYGNSPALDAIPAGTPDLCDGSIPLDQRGVPRPQGPACEVGAVEGDNGLSSGPLDLVVTSAIDLPDTAVGDGMCDAGGGSCTLRAAIDEANGWAGPDTITIASGVNPTISRPGTGEDLNAIGDLDVDGDLTIAGNGQTVSAAQLDRVFHQLDGALTLRQLQISDGMLSAQGSEGAGILAEARYQLTLDRVTISDNQITGTAAPAQGSSAMDG